MAEAPASTTGSTGNPLSLVNTQVLERLTCQTCNTNKVGIKIRLLSQYLEPGSGRKSYPWLVFPWHTDMCFLGTGYDEGTGSGQHKRREEWRVQSPNGWYLYQVNSELDILATKYQNKYSEKVKKYYYLGPRRYLRGPRY